MADKRGQHVETLRQRHFASNKPNNLHYGYLAYNDRHPKIRQDKGPEREHLAYPQRVYRVCC